MDTRVVREAFVVTDELKARFYAKTVEAKNGCLIWTAAVQRNGYGAFKFQGSKFDAHVFSWRLANNGESVPVGKLVMHLCDCRPCVNGDHLSLGTTSENMKMAHAGGRGEDFVRRGEEIDNAVLTENSVRMIRDEYAAGGISGRKLAAKHQLPYWAVKKVLSGENWKHVTSAAVDSVEAYMASLQPVRGAR